MSLPRTSSERRCRAGPTVHIRVLVANGLLAKAFISYAVLDGADVIDVFYVDIED